MSIMTVMTVLTPYTPQACLDGRVKDLFHENLQWTLAKIGASENLFVGISMVTLERMQMDMRKFMVVEDLEDVISRVREFLNLLSRTI